MPNHWIDFNPTDVDIVSTKLRRWTSKHPGNIFYTDLVHQRLVGLCDVEDQQEYRRVAEDIVDILTVERGGRFLKVRDGELNSTSAKCVVMDERAAIAKVLLALRTTKKRHLGGSYYYRKKLKKQQEEAAEDGQELESSSESKGEGQNARRRQKNKAQIVPNRDTEENFKEKRNPDPGATHLVILSKRDRNGDQHPFQDSANAADHHNDFNKITNSCSVCSCAGCSGPQLI